MFTFTASPVALAFLSFVGQSFVAAQSTTSYNSSATSTAATSASSGPFTHTISVAYAGFTFSPDVVQAEVGDVIEYDFYPTNHSVARSEFYYPCIPYEDTGIDKVGFFSGFKPVDVILDDPPKFQITVNDTNPIFYYCTAPNSCIGHQMVGVINPNSTTPIETQIQRAKGSTFMLQPGEPWPSESEPDPFITSVSSPSPTPTPIPTDTHTPSATSATPAATTTAAAAASSSHSSLSTGAIAGIAIGAAAVAILAAALLYMCGRQSRINERNNHPYHQPPQPYNPHMSYVPTHPKHLSVMTASTGYAGPALPGYIPPHDPAMSPPLHPVFPTSEALAAGSDITSPGSPVPSQTGVYAAPAYQQLHQQMPIQQKQQQPQPLQPQMYAPAPQGVHEMDTEQGGIVNFLRKASTRKSGVERYG